MLSQLDNIIYPDRCEVYEVIPSQRYVYVIFKNGHSSLLASHLTNKWKILFNEQLKKLESIDVILRDTKSRTISGINTYVQKTLAEHPDLDFKTVVWFAKNYLFLNRHYTIQFSWLLNLARFIHPDTRLNFLGMEDLSTLTLFDLKPDGVTDPSQTLIDELEKNIPNFEMFHRLDDALYTCIGKSLTFSETVERIKSIDANAYDWVIGKTLKVLDPLYVLSKT